MKYPQLSLRETNAPYMEEMKTAAAEVIEGGWYIRGKYVSRLEEQLCAYLGCRYAVATGNGLDALRLMLRAYIEMGVMQPGDEVIVPSNTYVASVLAITDNGLDGASISYTGDIGLGNNAAVNASITEMRQLLLDKITPLAKNGKIFFLESNPLFIPEANRDVFTRYVLNTTSSKNASQLRLLINEAIYYAGIPSDKLLITGDPELMTTDNNDGPVSQVPFFAIQVIDCGPIGGLMIQNVAADYSHANITYKETRGAIQTLNPSPLK